MDLSVGYKDLTPGQYKFLQSRAPAVLLSGGFGSGKTLGLGLKLLQMKALNPGVPGLLLAQTWRALWSVTLRRLLGFMRTAVPREYMPVIRDRMGECYLDFGDGAPVFLRSAHDPAGYDGLDVGWLLGDELRHWSRHAYEVALGRVRIKCALSQSAFSSTPEMHWMAEEFNTGKDGRHLIVSPTSENAKNLAPGFVDNLRLSYSKRLQRAVIDGVFTILEGAVYESFDSDTRTSPWLLDYDPRKHAGRKTILAIDPGYRRSSWIFFHEVKQTEWVAYDQFQGETMSDAACVSAINARPWPVDEIWVDPAADATQSGVSLDTIAFLKNIDMRSRSGIRYITGVRRDIAYGVDKMRVLLGDPEEGLPIRLFFAKRLLDQEKGSPRGIIKSLSAYRYPEIKDGRPLTNIPLKDGLYDHDCDAARYFGVGMWLTSPLRQLDPTIKDTDIGYKVAA